MRMRGNGDWSDRSDGGMGTNTVAEAQKQYSAIRAILEDLPTIEPCIVEEYDPAAGTVSVSLKNYPGMAQVHGVRVIGMGGNWGIIWPIIPYNKDKANATVGILLYLRSDSSESFASRSVHTAPTQAVHKGLGSIFIPDIALDSEPVPAATKGTTPVKVESGDFGLVNRKTGGCLLLKEDGGLEAHVAYARLVKIGSDRSALKRVAREGEAGGLAATSGTGFLEVTD